MDHVGNYIRSLKDAILGDPLDVGLMPKPISYEDVHSEIQSILIPPVVPKGISVHLMQPLNKRFALQHKVGLVPGDLMRTQMGMMPMPGVNYYSLSAITTVRTEQGGRYRLAGQYDPLNHVGKATILGKVGGFRDFRVQAQYLDQKSDKAPEWGLTARMTGERTTGVLRATHAKEIGASINTRLTEVSPITVGGEVFVNVPNAYKKIKSLTKKDNPYVGPGLFEYAVGAAYEAGLHKTALHFASTHTFPAVLSAHHLYRVTERSHLAAKCMVNLRTTSSMLAAGYKLRFRNTRTTLHGVLDSYGKAVVIVEREPIRDMLVTFSMEGRLKPGVEPGKAASFGLSVSVGGTSPITPPLSPCTMTRDIFSSK